MTERLFEPTDRPMSVSLGDIDVQRERGWTEFDAEDYCHRCGQRNVKCWYVSSPIWNAVMRHPDEASELWGIVCPQCFTEMYEAAFPDPPPIWRLVLTQGVHAEEADA